MQTSTWALQLKGAQSSCILLTMTLVVGPLARGILVPVSVPIFLVFKYQLILQNNEKLQYMKHNIIKYSILK